MPDTDPGAASPLSNTMTITLRTPITGLDGGTINEIALREPTAGEYVHAEKESGFAADIVLISLVAGVPRPTVEKIGARDFFVASRYLAAFAGNVPPAGEA